MGSGFIRLLIIALVVWIAVRLIRYLIMRQRRVNRDAPAAIPRMLPCAQCGVHVPEDRALRVGDRVYCEEHRPSN